MHALARHVINDAECHRRYGHFAKTKMVPTVVVNVLSTKVNGRMRITISGRYDLGGGSAASIKVVLQRLVDLNIRSVNKGPPPGEYLSQTPGPVPLGASASGSAVGEESGRLQGSVGLTVGPSLTELHSSGQSEAEMTPGARHLPQVPKLSFRSTVSAPIPTSNHPPLLQAPAYPENNASAQDGVPLASPVGAQTKSRIASSRSPEDRWGRLPDKYWRIRSAKDLVLEEEKWRTSYIRGSAGAVLGAS